MKMILERWCVGNRFRLKEITNRQTNELWEMEREREKNSSILLLMQCAPLAMLSACCAEQIKETKSTKTSCKNMNEWGHLRIS